MMDKYGNQCQCFAITVKDSYDHMKRSEDRKDADVVNP